jgi:hypothetical protein
LSAFIKMKTLWLALLLAAPPVAIWTWRGGGERTTPPVVAAHPTEKVAVEVLTADGKKQWMMVEVPHEAVPEPSSALLIMLSTLLLLRRNRGK